MYYVKINETTIIKQGDTNRTFNASIVDDNGAPVNISNSTVNLIMANRKVRVLEKVATITDGATGQFSFSFDEEDLTGNGTLDVEFQVVYADRKFTAPTVGHLAFDVQQSLTERGFETAPPNVYETIKSLVSLVNDLETRVLYLEENGYTPDPPVIDPNQPNNEIMTVWVGGVS